MSNTLNQIIFLNTDPRHIGGIEAFARLLNNSINKNFTFISLKSRKQKKEAYNLSNVINIKRSFIESIFLKSKFIKRLRTKRVNKIVSKLNPQFIIINSPNDYEYIKKVNVKKILVQHTTADLWKKRAIYFNNDDSLIKKIHNNIDLIVCLSPQDMEDVAETFGFNREKLCFIRHSSNIPILSENKKNNNQLVMISRFNNKIKRFDLAIEAMSLLPDFELHIYGSGKDETLLKKMAEKRSNVFIHGSTSNVQSVLDKHSIYISTSDFEGYPISSIEAIRRGLPIIMRNTHSSAADIICNNGILLDKKWDSQAFANSIILVKNNYEKFSQEAIKRAELYSLQNFKINWQKLLS